MLASKLCVPVAVAGALAFSGNAKADNNWIGANTASSWNDPLNWSAGTVPANEGVSIDTTNPSYPIITANITSTPVEIVIGGYGSTGRIDHRAGTFATASTGWPPGWMLIGYGTQGNATYNLADTSTTGGTFTGFGTGSGTLNLVNGLFMGEPGGGNGNGFSTLNVNTTGAINMNNDFNLGVSGWNATMNLDAGAFSSTNGTIWIPGGVNNNTNTTTSGILNEAGGSIDCQYRFNVGSSDGVGYTNLVGTVNLNGGTITTHGVNWWDGGVRLGANGGTGKFNLNGGTLTTLHVYTETNNGTGTSIFNFNGGTLKARASYNVPWSAFFGGFPDNSDGRCLTAAYVQAGGAIIDTAGFDNYIGEALLTGTNITDGGLTKNGAGQLEMDGANTFTGPVVVNGGTLYANGGGGPNNRAFSYCSSITVNTSATLQVNSSSLFGYDGSQAKPITVNAGGTASVNSGGDADIGQVTLNGGTLAGGPNSSGWGSWSFGRAAVNQLAATDNSLVTATNLAFYNGASINVAAGKILTVSGTIDDGNNGASSLIKSGGTGTLVLSGANTYTGNTTISAGVLALSGSGSLASPSKSIAPNATLDVSGLTAGGYSLSGALALSINKTGSTLTQGQVVLGAKNLTCGGTLTVVSNANSSAFASGDSFTLFTTSGTRSGWFSSVTLPALATGLTWDTNHLATAGILDVYTFTTTPLTVATLTNTPTTIPASKLASHASSSKGGVYPTGWTASASGATLGSVTFDGSGNLIYTSGGTAGTDNFTVTFFDGHGSQTMAVSVTVSLANVGPTLSLNNGYQNNGGYGSFTASGLPNTTYTVQISTDLTNWSDYATVTAAANGVISYTDTVTIATHGGTVYYRLKQ